MKLIWFWAATLVAAAEQNSYIGAAACKPCHPSQFARQSQSGHAQALHRAVEHPLAGRFITEGPVLRPPKFEFEVAAEPGGLHVRANDGKYAMELPLEWAFGAGDHAVTFVTQVSGEFYLEHSLSFYPSLNAFDLTPRHDALPANTLQQAMGQPIKTRGLGSSMTDCFGCHSTGPVSVSPTGELRVVEQGIRCEVCHGPGARHRATGAKAAITKPPVTGEAVNQFCGKCHRVTTAAFDWNSPWTVRHQPPYLARSRCFLQSSGKLSCLTCHDPHERIRRNDEAYYGERCRHCHAPAKSCQADCTSCHMPDVSFGSHMKFKNHWIGVYRAGDVMKPAR